MDLIDNFRIDQWAIRWNLDDDVCFEPLSRPVVAIEQVRRMAAEAWIVFGGAQGLDGVVASIRRGGDDNRAGQLNRLQPFQHACENRLAHQRQQHFARQAARIRSCAWVASNRASNSEAPQLFSPGRVVPAKM